MQLALVRSAYLFFLVSKKLSTNKISRTKSINVTNWALAAIKSFNKIIIPSVSANANKPFLFIFTFVIYNNAPSIQLKITVDKYIPVIPPNIIYLIYCYII